MSGKEQLLATEILNSALRRKQAARPEYSLRALARDLGVSAPFVSAVFKGDKRVPKTRLQALCQALELDVQERATLVRIVRLDQFSSKIIAGSQAKKKIKNIKPRKLLPSGKQSLISKWWYLPVLEGFTLASPYNESEWIRTRLLLSREQFDSALNFLISNQLLILQSNGTYAVADEHVYIPTGRSKREIREFHEAMMAKARTELVTKTSDEDFHRRLITGFTFSLSPDQMEECKSSILDFLNELTQNLSKKPGLDIYQCNLQLFPLSTKVSS